MKISNEVGSAISEQGTRSIITVRVIVVSWAVVILIVEVTGKSNCTPETVGIIYVIEGSYLCLRHARHRRNRCSISTIPFICNKVLNHEDVSKIILTTNSSFKRF